MRINLPIKVELKGKAHSTYDRATIERRLDILATRDDQAAREEEVFLRDLLQREYSGEPPTQGKL